MKKNWLIALIFVINVVTLHAQFTTPGTGVTWDLDDLVSHSEGAVSLSGGEYFINDDLIIATSDTIRIETNAIVRFLGGKLITVNGVDWFPQELTAGYRFTTTGRVANVELSVPDDYAPEAEALVDLAQAVSDTVPLISATP